MSHKNMTEPTTTQADTEKELQERLAKFMDAYKKLVDEHQADFAAFPVFVPDGQGAFKVIIQMQPVDMRNRPQKSPFVAPAKDDKQA